MASHHMLGLINLQDNSVLQKLNETRPLATMPIGGKFRLIDFTLSNMVNAGINNVGILLSHQSRSVLDHIRSGKEWGLAHKGDGLFTCLQMYRILSILSQGIFIHIIRTSSLWNGDEALIYLSAIVIR